VGSTEKLERLLNLTAALLETSRPLTAVEISAKVPGYPKDKVAFHRAFERDKEDLREMGVPLVTAEIIKDELPELGYRIPKDQYYLRDPGLQPDELAALHLAASAVRLDGIQGAGALWKLGGVPIAAAGAAGDEAHLVAIPTDERVVTLFTAVADRRPVTFRYRDEDRTVDPYRLDFQRGRWYVSGFDHARGEERNFRLDRVEGGVDAGAPRSFERPATGMPGAQLEPWQLGEGDPVLGRVLIDADQAAIAVSALGDEAVAEQRVDGSVVVELAVTNQDGFRSFVLGFLEHAEVLGPDDLRAGFVEWLEALAR
jgi:predicted DNA-binding transcriptional regulator YafY